MIPDNSQLTLITDENADFIFKKSDYIHTYITIETSGLPNGSLLFLLDENFEQLYSPYDTNGNQIKTQCYITSGETDIIPLPASYTSSGEWEDFDSGIYEWNLKFYGNEYYDGINIPLTVEIRDFSVCTLIKRELYPFDNLEIQVKTYVDTIPSSNEIDLYNDIEEYIQTDYEYDSTNGIIKKELNNMDFGVYHIFPKNHSIYDIEFEIIPPLELSYTVIDNSFQLIAQYWLGKNIPASNQYVAIKNIDTDEIVYIGQTNDLGKIYYNTTVEGHYQALTYFYKKVITDISLDSNQDLIYSMSTSTDNNGVISDIEIDTTTNNINMLIESFLPDTTVFNNITFDGNDLYLNINDQNEQIEYTSNIILLDNYDIYTDINLNVEGNIVTDEILLLDMINQELALIAIEDSGDGNLEVISKEYSLFDNVITDIKITDGMLEYENIDDL